MLRRCFVLLFFAAVVWTSGSAVATGPAPKSRTFEFTYDTTITGLQPFQHYRMWVPVPQSNEYQDVMLVQAENSNFARQTRDRKFGNAFYFIEGPANEKGEGFYRATYRVTRREVTGPGRVPSPSEAQMFLQADQLVPISGKPLTLISDKKLPAEPMKKARTLYDIVNEHMKYSKEGTGWGRGDSNWACDSKYGNCCDFHSLFMSLARAEKMPAKFEMGFPIPDARGEGVVGGYHCWAFFQPEPGKGWTPVDISEADKHPQMTDYYFGNLTENRVTFTTGRDIILDPPQAGPPVNYIIYPYCEVDGKPVAADKIKKVFKYKDLN
jgi:transglutaminase-like putative cysteine protease